MAQPRKTRRELNSRLVELATELLKIKLCILNPRQTANRPPSVAHIVDSVQLTDQEIQCQLYMVFIKKSKELNSVYNDMVIWFNQYASVRSVKLPIALTAGSCSSNNDNESNLLLAHQQEIELKLQIIRALCRRDSIECRLKKESPVDRDVFPPVLDEEYGSYCLALLQTEPFLPAD